MDNFFKISQRNSTVKTEVIAGITTFMTMAYVLAVQSAAIVGFGSSTSIVDAAGVEISKSSLLIMCALVSGLVTLMMGLYANLPFALSTGMGSNFMLGALVQSGSFSFAQCMGIVLTGGIVFVLLTAFGIRDLIVKIIPKNIKVAISAAIGFFIAYLGFKNTGIGNFTNGIGMGDFTSTPVILAILGLIIISVLTAYKVKGAILIGIIAVTLIGIPFGITTLPANMIAIPSFETVQNVMFNVTFKGIFRPESIVLVFIVFFGDFFSTLGTVLGVAGKAKMLDENGNLPGIEKPFLVDAIGTCAGALCGCTTITTFVESSAGVEEGGRTGLTSVVTALLFFVAMFLSPLFLMIPDAATGPALIFVGFLMISGFADIDFSNFDDAFGPFVMIVFGIFCGSIAAGIAAGILAHVVIKVLTGKFKEVHIAMYALCIPLLMYFIFS